MAASTLKLKSSLCVQKWFIFFVKTSMILISLDKDFVFMPSGLYNFNVKTFRLNCYRVIYFTCSCLNRMCKMISGNSSHEAISLKKYSSAFSQCTVFTILPSLWQNPPLEILPKSSTSDYYLKMFTGSLMSCSEIHVIQTFFR